MKGSSLNQINLRDILFSMGGVGILLFLLGYCLFQKNLITIETLIFFDVLIFIFPHLIASYLRASSNSSEINRYAKVLFFLPLLVFVAIGFFVLNAGKGMIWMLGTLYFYWQWWHHSRQSFGIGRKFQRDTLVNSTMRPYSDKLSKWDYQMNDAAIWSVALIGIVLRSHFVGYSYGGIPIKVVHFSDQILFFPLAGLTIYVFFYLIRQLYLFFQKKIIQVPFLIHWVIQSFVFICFFGILPADLGIIGASFWHCTQYMCFVRDHQELKLKNNLIENSLLQNIYKGENWILFFVILFCFGLLLNFSTHFIRSFNLKALTVLYWITIVFHHYILDSIVWSRKEVEWSLWQNSPKLAF